MPVRAADPRPRRPGTSTGATARCRRATVWLAVIAGVFFAGDLLSWHHAVDAVGAGLATVLGNLQVIVVALVAWLVFGSGRRARAAGAADRARRRRADLGRVGSGAYGANPPLGVALGIFTALSLRGLSAGHPARLERPPAARRARSRSRPRRRPSSRSSVGIAARRARPGAGWPSHGWLALVGITSPVDRLPDHLDLAAAAAGGPRSRSSCWPSRS